MLDHFEKSQTMGNFMGGIIMKTHTGKTVILSLAKLEKSIPFLKRVKALALAFTFILFAILCGCAGTPLPAKHEGRCVQIKEEWLPAGFRPEWIDKIPEAKEGLKFFIGQSNEYSSEKEARDRAYKDAVNQVVAYCGVSVQVMYQYVSFHQGPSSKIADPNIAEREEILHRMDAFVSRIKSVEYVLRKADCLMQYSDNKTSFIAYVLVSVPEDEPHKILAWRKAMAKKEAELRPVFEKIRAANQELHSGLVTPALQSLVAAEEHLQRIGRDEQYYAAYTKLQKDYGLSCHDLAYQIEQLLSSVRLQKTEGDNQQCRLGISAIAPLSLQAASHYAGQDIPLKNQLIIFQDNQGNVLQKVRTDADGVASYVPKISNAGTYYYNAVLSMEAKGGSAAQKEVTFSLNVGPRFTLSASLDRSFYLAGDKAAITISVSGKAALAIFNCMADNTVAMLYPPMARYNTEKAKGILGPETTFYFPPPDSDVVLEMHPLPGHVTDRESFVVVAVPLTEEGDFLFTDYFPETRNITLSEFNELYSQISEEAVKKILSYEVRRR
ncbi:MAG: hypothetical protein JXA79_11535 [Deltaproteobacteria bacterium]|nr:hypothetical protein [Deltaproteobacteria bacterium]